MKNKQIVFTSRGVAELLEKKTPGKLGEKQVWVDTEYTIISPGTERANLMGEYNISGRRSGCHTDFPRSLGYAGVGTVRETSDCVKRVSEGDRVVIYKGKHQKYNLILEDKVMPVPEVSIKSEEAVFTVIAAFSAAGVRKTRLELGESVMVMGLGILGLLSVQFSRIAGAVPVIGVDPHPQRREYGVKMGADAVFDPYTEGFARNIRSLTGDQGVDVVVEVSGVAQALNQALECTAPLGRVSLLGCTRNPAEYDLYHQVHYPGIQLFGAHNAARPQCESYPGNWTFEDDCRAVLDLISHGRLDVTPLICEIQSPDAAPEVYERLAHDKDFPVGVLFDWRKI